MNNNLSNNNQGYVNNNNYSNIQPFIRSSFQYNNVINYGLYNQHQLNNSTPLSYFPRGNTNYSNSL